MLRRSWFLLTVTFPLLGCTTLAPPVISPFGAMESSRRVPHVGTDYRVPIGTPILAVADGTVRYARRDLGNNTADGNSIAINHTGSLRTVYNHLHAIFVSDGQYVERGDVIGLSGNTGSVKKYRRTAPHLHFEVRFRGDFVNPYPKYWYGGEGKPLAFDPSVSYPPERNLFSHPVAFGPYYSEAKRIAKEKVVALTRVTQRPISVEWEDYRNFTSKAELRKKIDVGEIYSILLPDDAGSCTFNSSFNEDTGGTWSLVCPNGMLASGTLEAWGNDKGPSGVGADTEGRVVRFTMGALKDQ